MTSSSNVSRGNAASAPHATNEFTHVAKTQKQNATKRRKACGIGRLSNRRDGRAGSLHSNPSTFVEPRRFHPQFGAGNRKSPDFKPFSPPKNRTNRERFAAGPRRPFEGLRRK